MRRLLLAVVLFFLTFSFSGVAQTTPESIAYANKAIKAMEPMPPTLWKARSLLGLGVLFAKSGHAATAARLYKQAQTVADTTTVKTMYGKDDDGTGALILAMAQEKFPSEVASAQYRGGDLAAALKTAGGDVEGLLTLVSDLVDAGDLVQAQRVADRISDESDRKWAALSYLAPAYARRGDCDRALAVARSASTAGSRGQILADVAFAMAFASRTAEARAAAEEAEEQFRIADQKKDPYNNTGLAAAFGAIGDVDHALAVARQREEGPLRDLRIAAIARAQAGRSDLVGASRTAGILGKADRMQLMSELASIAASKGERATAHTLCQDAVKAATEPDPNELLAWMFTSLSIDDVGANCTQAREDALVEQLLQKSGSDKGRVQNAIVGALIRRGDAERAVTMLSAVDADDLPDVLESLANTYARQDKTARVNALLQGRTDAKQRASIYSGAAWGSFWKTRS